MARRKPGLGAGSGKIENARDETAAELVRRITAEAADGTERTMKIALAALSPAPWQPRRDSGSEEIRALARSIRRDGLLQPLLVRPHPGEAGRYQVVFGHRRLEAMRVIADREGVPEAEYRVTVRVRVCSDLEARVLTSAENLHRKDLNAYEMALDVVGVREALRAEGLPCSDRDLAHYFRRGAGTMAEYRVIGTHIDEALLRTAGFAVDSEADAPVDWALVGQLTKAELHSAAKAAGPTARLGRLRRAAEAARARLVEEMLPRGRRTAEAPEVAPRFTAERLHSHGGFAVKLSKPFGSYSGEESRRYLGDLLPAVAALARNVAGEAGRLVERNPNGVLAFVAGDLERFDSVDELATRVRELHGAIEELSEIMEIAVARVRTAAERRDGVGGCG